jgi:predicted ATP-dependent endonuclease of OLD family
MRIDRLHVRNFRCFAEQDFSFHPRFNVLIGDNVTGKTAVLKALRIAVASWFLDIKGPKTVAVR